MTSSSHADVRMVQVLRDLDGALQRFAVHASGAIEEIRARCDRMRARLDDRADDAARNVRHCAAMRDSADDDDADYWRNALVEARERRDDVNRWQRRVEEAYDAFRRDTAHFDGMLQETVRRGRDVLHTKIDLLNEYLAIQLDGDGSVDRSSVDVTGNTPGGIALVAYPLPAGFQWIPLAWIELRQEPSDVQSAAEFRKTDKESMRQGLMRLQEEILPRLTDEEARTSEYFARLDTRNAAGYEHGLQRIFDAFFGLDHVHLDRANAAGMFSVTNGRHRIRIAQELAWDAIPAKLDQREGPA